MCQKHLCPNVLVRTQARAVNNVAKSPSILLLPTHRRQSAARRGDRGGSPITTNRASHISSAFEQNLYDIIIASQMDTRVVIALQHRHQCRYAVHSTPRLHHRPRSIYRAVELPFKILIVISVHNRSAGNIGQPFSPILQSMICCTLSFRF